MTINLLYKSLSRFKSYCLITATLILSFSLAVNAQKLDYETDSGFDFGFGIGGSYQQSDVRNSQGSGIDFRFGHSIYKRPSSFFALDWRLRFLVGENSAFDDRINQDGTYNNVQYTHLNSDLELVLTLNSLLNKTGIIVSGFAGAGLAYNITKFDNYDSINGSVYDYSVINPSGNVGRSTIYRELKVLSDNDFETVGTNYVSISPTAGIFLGYQFSKRFSIGIEHKVNFFFNENNSVFGANIDGVINAGSPYDRNNYTSIQFKWDIRKKSSPIKAPVEEVNEPTNDLIAAPCNPPKITFTVTESNSRFSAYELSGTIARVDDRSAISVQLNGLQDDSFQFLPGTNRISSMYQLRPGRNVFTVFARNECGEDSETFTVLLEDSQSPCELPYIDFQVIEVNDINLSHELNGTINNVGYQSAIAVQLDGRQDYNFQYNARTNRLISKYRLSPGRHFITITAKNDCGEDSQSVTVYMRQEQTPCELPAINFQVNEVNNRQELTGTLGYINYQSNITVKLDGRTNNNFQYDPRTKRLSSIYQLSPGRHVLTVIAINDCGEDSETLTFFVRETQDPCQVPEINIQINEVNKESASHELTGTLVNINNKSNITIKLDGRTDNNFQFEPRSNQIRSSYKLSPGRHSISVSAKNDCGEDVDTRTVIVNEPISPCITPKITLYLVEEPKANFTHKLTANITEVLNKSQITVQLDGRPNDDFDFNPRAKQLSSLYKLSPGRHTLTVTAKNNCGEDVATATVVVEEPEAPCVPPKVTLSVVEQASANFTHRLTATVSEVISKANITVKVDGRLDNNFQFNANTKQMTANYKFSTGSHTIVVTAKNECGQDVKKTTVTIIDQETACGPRINPGNADWQFCLVTPKGTFNRANLSDSQFNYTGSASSLYFKAIAGGGNVTVNGSPYTIRPGQYYLFTGQLNVTVSTKNSGSMGNWSVCIETKKAPIYGVGRERPTSPCEEKR